MTQSEVVLPPPTREYSSTGDFGDFDNDDLDDLEGWTTADFISENDFDMIDMLSAALEQVSSQLDEKQREFRVKSSEWTSKTKEQLRKQTNKLENRKIRIQEQLKRHYNAIDRRMNKDAKTVQLRDKISFVIGVSNACVAPALALRYPSWIPGFYSTQLVLLLTLRYVIYRSKRWHYFIFDMCYFVNGMMILFLQALPWSKELFIAIFCLTNGPVAWAIVTWRNSLVFHSLDKVTSVFIHIFPPLVTYIIRWMPELQTDSYCSSSDIAKAYRDARFPALAELSHMRFKDAMIYSTLAYAVWQALYFIFVMVRRREKVESGLRLTSYSWLLNDTHGKKGFIQKAAFCFGSKYKLHMFMLLQLVYNVVTSMPTYLLYKYFWLHSLFLIAMFATSVWNGATYYIEVFSRRYIVEIERKMVENETKQVVAVEKQQSVPNTDIPHAQ
ncbi:uncharacterized protein BYT42DRAFT_564637 [Radiomyces spectabilis]|uniref:uncharacterized protein n=1 Tax=Radiomyces spectabilis TaxID=64574 RepID=UPI00221F7F0E|nr:uncharacterized protein BYT42DRAFT_564637 [Radiomyces spectabilis]KAI8380905.1 hypothetical protein BYT42DRAFT_564637 [Radiomyces spectabilis]